MNNPEGERVGSFKRNFINTEKKGGYQNGKFKANFVQSSVESIASDAQYYCVGCSKVGSGFCTRAVQEELRQEEVIPNRGSLATAEGLY